MNPTFPHTEFNSNKLLDCIAIHFNFYRSILVTYSLFAGRPCLFLHHCYDISLVSEARTPTTSLYTSSLSKSYFTGKIPGRWEPTCKLRFINVEKNWIHDTWMLYLLSHFFFLLVSQDRNYWSMYDYSLQ